MPARDNGHVSVTRRGVTEAMQGLIHPKSTEPFHLDKSALIPIGWFVFVSMRSPLSQTARGWMDGPLLTSAAGPTDLKMHGPRWRARLLLLLLRPSTYVGSPCCGVLGKGRNLITALESARIRPGRQAGRQADTLGLSCVFLIML